LQVGSDVHLQFGVYSPRNRRLLSAEFLLPLSHEKAGDTCIPRHALLPVVQSTGTAALLLQRLHVPATQSSVSTANCCKRASYSITSGSELVNAKCIAFLVVASANSGFFAYKLSYFYRKGVDGSGHG
jgi:hypothetical protein